MHAYLYLYSLMMSAIVAFVPALATYLGPFAPAPPQQQTATPGEPQTITRTMTWPAGQRHVFELSNIDGDVHIVAEERADVSIVATRTVKREGRDGAPTPTVDFRQDAERLIACGDNLHCGCRTDARDDDARQGSRWQHDDGIRGEDMAQVKVDFEVHVPRALTLNVCTVNARTLRVEGTEGPFTFRNVNGGLELIHLRGAGIARTVNGTVSATFTAPPSGPTDFKTVNGRIDVTLPATLAADLRLKTLHGALYTDFDATALPRTPVLEQKNGRSTYRFDRAASFRVGAGGVALSFETLNGDIMVRKPR